jgi:hypothetical protein
MASCTMQRIPLLLVLCLLCGRWPECVRAAGASNIEGAEMRARLSTGGIIGDVADPSRPLEPLQILPTGTAGIHTNPQATASITST